MKKVVLKWGNSVSKKLIKARLVRQSMADNAVLFPNPDPPLQEIADKADELEAAEAEAEQGGTDRTIARDARLAELKLLMLREVLYVQLITNGVPELVAMAGLDTQDEPTKWPKPEAMSEFLAVPGGNQGTVLLTMKAPKYKRMFVIERYVENTVKPADPSAPEPTPTVGGRWEKIAVQGKQKYVVEGLVSGSNNRFRVAAVNAAGMGDYSAEVASVAR